MPGFWILSSVLLKVLRNLDHQLDATPVKHATTDHHNRNRQRRHEQWCCGFPFVLLGKKGWGEDKRTVHLSKLIGFCRSGHLKKSIISRFSPSFCAPARQHQPPPPYRHLEPLQARVPQCPPPKENVATRTPPNKKDAPKDRGDAAKLWLVGTKANAPII